MKDKLLNLILNIASTVFMIGTVIAIWFGMIGVKVLATAAVFIVAVVIYDILNKKGAEEDE